MAIEDKTDNILLSIEKDSKIVAYIDSKGDYHCLNKQLVFIALREEILKLDRLFQSLERAKIA